MSKGGSPATTTQTTTSEFPTELRPYINDILERAKAQAERKEEEGYQPYTGPRIAEFEPEQLTSQQAIRDFVGRGVAASPALSSAQTYYTPALGLTLGQAEKFGAQQASQYMSPYQQAVIDVEKREAMRSFEPQMQQIGAQAVGAGGFGGSRQAILEAEAGRNLQQQLGDIQTRGLQSAYDRAQAAFEAQKSRERGAAGALSQMGAALPAQALKEIGTLQALGAERQQMAQRALDLGYSQFQEEQMYPTRGLQEYQSIIRGFPFTPSTYSTQSYIAPPASLAQNVLGIGTGIAGLAGAFGGFKEGGTIRLQEAGSVLPFQQGERRVVSVFGKEKQYEFKDGEWYQVKKDNTLGSKAPPLVRANLMNVDEEGAAESGIVATTEKPMTIGEDRDIGTMLFGPPEETDIIIPSTSQAQPQVTTTTEEITPEVVTKAVETMTSQSSVDPTKKVPPGTTFDSSNLNVQTTLSGVNDIASLKEALMQAQKDIASRPTETDAMKALRAEYGKLKGELGERETERKEELKKQKYLQLAEFGRGLLGADTTKGLLAQVAQAGERPLAKVGELIGEEGEISDKTRAERLGILGKEADIEQAAMTAERQKTADTISLASSLADVIEAEAEASGLSNINIPGATEVNNIIMGSGLGAVYEKPGVAQKINEALQQSYIDLRNYVLEGGKRDDLAMAATFNKIFSDKLAPIMSAYSEGNPAMNNNKETAQTELDKPDDLGGMY